MKYLILIFLCGCSSIPQANFYKSETLTVSQSTSRYSHNTDIFRVGMRAAWVLHDVSECMSIKPGNHKMIIKYTNDIYINHPGNDGVMLSRQGFPVAYSEIKPIDMWDNLRVTRHEIIHFLLFTQGDPDQNHQSKFWALCG